MSYITLLRINLNECDSDRRVVTSFKDEA